MRALKAVFATLITAALSDIIGIVLITTGTPSISAPTGAGAMVV
ncbi:MULTISPECIES: hypothetical protein [Microvirga]|uniref:Uncharacterized protein n=1 Tax=Microvirga arabica TaxID=1128671 RepID=A0ABV6Y988_9HYPH|nr:MULTISPECIES: hypothetical protein [Microvirga]